MSALDELDRLRRRDPDLAEELARVVMDLCGMEPEPGLTRSEAVVVRALKAARGATVSTEGLVRALDVTRPPQAERTDPRTVLTYVHRIREKIRAGLDLGGWPANLHGFGYRWDAATPAPGPTAAERAARMLDALRRGKSLTSAELRAVAAGDGPPPPAWQVRYCLKLLRGEGHAIRRVARAYLLEAA